MHCPKGVKHFFRPEFINRIDEQIVFRPLDEDNISKILEAILNEISEGIKERYNITLVVTEEARNILLIKVIALNMALESFAAQLKDLSKFH